MKFEGRLRQIEQRLKPHKKHVEYEHQYLDLLDFPKEETIETFATLKEAGGYHLMFTREECTALGEEQIKALEQLTPTQFYELMMTNREKQIEL